MKRRIIPILCLCAISCGNKDKRAQAALDVEAGATVEAALPTHEDPGPTLTRRTGALPPTVRPTSNASVDRIERVDGAVLAVVPLPDEAVPATGGRTSWIVEAGDMHGTAFAWSGTRVDNPQLGMRGVIVRVRGKELPPSFTVRWAHSDQAGWGARRYPGSLGSVAVTVPPKPVAAKGLEPVFWQAASDWFRGARGEFMEYASARAGLRSGRDTALHGLDGRPRHSDLRQMMDLYTGVTSVNEALQADRGLRLFAQTKAERTVDPKDIKRMELTMHPWDRMIADIDGKPSVEPLAAYVPADMAYMHFHDLRTLVKLAADLDDWVSPVAQWLEERPGASHFVSRYEEQLVLERSGLAEKLGHVAAKGVVVTTSDPYLREGTDVSMIFHVANRGALLAALGAFETAARARHANVATQNLQIAGVNVRRIHTADGRVDQYRAEYGEVLAISNSPGAMAALIAAHQGKTPRVSEQGDFRYMRAIYPWSTADEDGFVFLSDAFVMRVVSPELKILEARRMEARADLLAVNHAALLRGWFDGEVASSASDLVEAGFLAREELQHADDAEISFTADAAARSSWGSVARLTPLRDLELGKVSAAEVAAYDQFRESYQQYWRAHFDPVGARIKRSADGKRIDVDARMLPLIEATDYDELVREVGLQKVIPPTPGEGAEWTLAIGREAKLRKELDSLASGFVGHKDVNIGWLGDWVSFGFADRSGLWDMALRTRVVPSIENDTPDPWAGLEVLRTFPVYAAVHVRNSIGLAALLTGLKKWVSDAAPGMVDWGPTEPYRDIAIVSVGGGRGAEELHGLQIHYATVGDVFVVAFDHATLRGLIDRHLAGHGPQAPTGPPSESAGRDTQATLDLQSGPGGWLAKTVLGMAETVTIEKHDEVMDDYEVLWRGRGGGAALTPDDVRAAGVAYLGREPRSPHGGKFLTVDSFPSHSLYGDSVRPTMPDVPIADSPITDVVARLQRLSMAIEFEGEGDHRGLHTTFGWRWK